MKTIYEIKEILLESIRRIEADLERPFNRNVIPYLEGKRNGYRTIVYYIDSFSEKKIENDLDEYFYHLVKRKVK